VAAAVQSSLPGPREKTKEEKNLNERAIEVKGVAKKGGSDLGMPHQ